MRLSTRACYALRVMTDLATHTSGRPVPREQIASRQGISATYVAQLFRRLRQAQLVKATKGPGGGYMLARDPATICVGEVLRAVEGPLAVSQCILPRDEFYCERAESCAVRLLLARLTQAIINIVDSVTLQDLCNQTAIDTAGT